MNCYIKKCNIKYKIEDYTTYYTRLHNLENEIQSEILSLLKVSGINSIVTVKNGKVNIQILATDGLNEFDEVIDKVGEIIELTPIDYNYDLNEEAYNCSYPTIVFGL